MSYRDLDRHLHASNCDDSRPIISPVGFGPKGDSFAIEVHDNEEENKTTLTGHLYSESEEKWTEIWESPNINGGRLSCNTAYKEEEGMKLFQLQFIYSRPGRSEWMQATPWIPYTGEAPEPGHESITIDQLSIISGLTVDQLTKILDGIQDVIISPKFPDVKADNIIDYINQIAEQIKEITLNYATEEDIKELFE